MANDLNEIIPAAEVMGTPIVSVVESDVDKAKDVISTAVATAEDAVDGVVSEIKKLLDLYKHDIPIWDEIVALAKKV